MVLQSIPSMVFGCAERFELYGISVQFVDYGDSIIKKIALGLFAGHYYNMLVHEIGHSLAFKYVDGKFGDIKILSYGSGLCFGKQAGSDPLPTNAQNFLIDVAGPLANSVFALGRALAIRRSINWIRYRQQGVLTGCQTALFTILKIQNMLCALFPLAEFMILVQNRNASMERMAFGSDFMQIYAHAGVAGVIGSSILLATISKMAINITKNHETTERYERLAVNYSAIFFRLFTRRI